jgi:hypothetical protein
LSRKNILLRAHRIRKAGTGTDAQYEECIREHLPYEINMLRAMYGTLLSRHEGAAANAFIESFFLHVRNLIAFFANDTDCGFDLRYFTNAEYRPNSKFVPAGLLRRINQQIQHLGAERTDSRLLKLGPLERTTVYDLIEQQIERFEVSLEPPFKLSCQAGRIRTSITAPGAPGPSNAIFVP